MIGARHGMLVVKERLKGSKLVCECDCGNERIIYVGHLNAGYFSSCGCHVNRHGHGKHGKRSREYISYHNMIARCTKPTNKRFKDYGGAGITVCDRWLQSFTDFLDDMGACPEGYQIDRKDNTKGYAPDNCRWVSRKKNQANRSVSKIYVINSNEFHSAQEAADHYGVNSNTIIHWCGLRKRKGGGYYAAKDGCHWRSVYG